MINSPSVLLWTEISTIRILISYENNASKQRSAFKILKTLDAFLIEGSDYRVSLELSCEKVKKYTLPAMHNMHCILIWFTEWKYKWYSQVCLVPHQFKPLLFAQGRSFPDQRKDSAQIQKDKWQIGKLCTKAQCMPVYCPFLLFAITKERPF